MNQRCTNRSRLPRYSLVFLGLAVLIFTWGLQYKLSLYSAPHSIARHMVQAKLLSNDEQASVPEYKNATGPSDPAHVLSPVIPGALFIPLLAFSILFASTQRWQQLRASEQSWRAPSQASFTAFFFRPPPARF